MYQVAYNFELSNRPALGPCRTQPQLQDESPYYHQESKLAHTHTHTHTHTHKGPMASSLVGHWPPRELGYSKLVGKLISLCDFVVF